jgi:hypothetical protein
MEYFSGFPKINLREEEDREGLVSSSIQVYSEQGSFRMNNN